MSTNVVLGERYCRFYINQKGKALSLVCPTIDFCHKEILGESRCISQLAREAAAKMIFGMNVNYAVKLKLQDSWFLHNQATGEFKEIVNIDEATAHVKALAQDFVAQASDIEATAIVSSFALTRIRLHYPANDQACIVNMAD